MAIPVSEHFLRCSSASLFGLDLSLFIITTFLGLPQLYMYMCNYYWNYRGKSPFDSIHVLSWVCFKG